MNTRPDEIAIHCVIHTVGLPLDAQVFSGMFWYISNYYQITIKLLSITINCYQLLSITIAHRLVYHSTLGSGLIRKKNLTNDYCAMYILAPFLCYPQIGLCIRTRKIDFFIFSWWKSYPLRRNNRTFDQNSGRESPSKLITQKILIKSFCRSQLPHKSVNLSFLLSSRFPHKSVNLSCILTNMQNKLTDLWGSLLLPNGL